MYSMDAGVPGKVYSSNNIQLVFVYVMVLIGTMLSIQGQLSVVQHESQ